MPVAGIAGDQQAALFGQACHRPGLGKNTYGTGSFVLLNTGGEAPPAERGADHDGCLGSRRAHRLRARGQHLRHRRRRSMAARRARPDLARPTRRRRWPHRCESNDGVYFVPALTGLGSPHWDPYARGTIVGLTRGTRREHLARATLEAIAYQTFDAIEAMEEASGLRLEELRADGGAVVNRWLMQFQADVLGRPVVVPEVAETTALGAAYLAGDRDGRLDARPGRARCGGRRRATSPGWATTSAGPCCTTGAGRSSGRGAGRRL